MPFQEPLDDLLCLQVEVEEESFTRSTWQALTQEISMCYMCSLNFELVLGDCRCPFSNPPLLDHSMG